MHSLNSHIERVTIHRDRFCVIPTARGQRFPVGAKHWRHFGVRDAARPRALIEKAAAKP